MKNLLIKMSRRRSLMVPAVTLLAIGIGISGYYIQNRQIVAREQEQQAAQRDEQDSQPNSNTPAELSPVDTVDESTKINEDGQATEVVNLTLTVARPDQDETLTLLAEVDSDEPGVCVFYFKQGNYGPEETVSTKDRKCQVQIENPGNGKWEAKVLYTSDDGMTRGDALQEVEL